MIWASYANTQLVTANFKNQSTADSYAFGFDGETPFGLSMGAGFTFFREDISGITRLYSLNLSWRI